MLGAQFTCFASTKVQILTPEAYMLRSPSAAAHGRGSEERGGAERHRAENLARGYSIQVFACFTSTKVRFTSFPSTKEKQSAIEHRILRAGTQFKRMYLLY